MNWIGCNIWTVNRIIRLKLRLKINRYLSPIKFNRSSIHFSLISCERTPNNAHETLIKLQWTIIINSSTDSRSNCIIKIKRSVPSEFRIYKLSIRESFNCQSTAYRATFSIYINFVYNMHTCSFDCKQPLEYTFTYCNFTCLKRINT